MEKQKQQSERIITSARAIDETNLMASSIEYVQRKYQNYDTRRRSVESRVERHYYSRSTR